MFYNLWQQVNMVIVAQLAEHLTVDHEVAGSSPVDHPLCLLRRTLHSICTYRRRGKHVTEGYPEKDCVGQGALD